MEFPENLRYTEEHEWISVEGDHALIGVTDYAQSELGDVVFVELPEAGGSMDQGSVFGPGTAVPGRPASGPIEAPFPPDANASGRLRLG